MHFYATQEQPSHAIGPRLNNLIHKELEENQHVIESLFKVVILLGKQGLGFCGHRDDKIIWEEEEYKEENQGNFIELVRFGAETDSIVKKHL